jgi:hypothetical protein
MSSRWSVALHGCLIDVVALPLSCAPRCNVLSVCSCADVCTYRCCCTCGPGVVCCQRLKDGWRPVHGHVILLLLRRVSPVGDALGAWPQLHACTPEPRSACIGEGALRSRTGDGVPRARTRPARNGWCWCVARLLLRCAAVLSQRVTLRCCLFGSRQSAVDVVVVPLLQR